ncbi:ribosome biogenesis GTPase Der [Xanthomonadaceae bacterium JHOS43]|nr:ribosome biogenesis GTPase Der [Xanthomonadaceae bacterium JHOS43]MCX7563493.1 ribosome biogenesis GTPase Der [Xanthomonadaceae bacterium XH05]
MLPLVALVGRPNVGKSTLFNSLTRSRDALVHDEPGVTRDRHYGVCRRIEDRPFAVVDTGGISGEDEGLAGLTALQSQSAIEEADLVVFVVDAKHGPSTVDEDILQLLRRSGKPVLLALNKIDAADAHEAEAEFARFGLPDVFRLSAAHQRGVDDLLDEIVERLPDMPEGAAEEDEPDRLRLAIVGRPNVGKSTLVNRLLGEDRVIASDVPGTTRDSISVDMERDGRKYRLIDTAGIRRKSKVEEAVEKFSVIKSLRAIEMAQVVVFMIDASEGVTDQDATVLGQVLDAGRALVIAVNKWDGLSEYQREQTKSALDRRLNFVPWAEHVTISAKHGSGLRELLRAVQKAHRSAGFQFVTSDLTRVIETAVAAHQPPPVRGHAAKLRFAHPGGTHPPTAVIHGNRVKSLPDSYKRYLENYLRQHYKLIGTPLKLEFRQGENPYADKVNPLTDRQIKQRRRMMRHVKR